MKSILFFHFDLGHGGAEKVLVNLLNSLDTTKYKVTLKTLFHYGVNSCDLSENIKWEWVFDCKPYRGISYILKILSPSMLHKLFIKERYDFEIAYLEGPSTRVISGCRNDDTKIFTWVHTSFKDNNIIFRTYRRRKEFFDCYKRFDGVAAVSRTAKDEFERLFDYSIRATVVNNVIDIKSICKQSEEAIPFEINDNLMNFCSVGRLIWVKGYERLIDVVNVLVNRLNEKQFHIYILGEGELHNKLEQKLVDYSLTQYVTFLGYDANPYKYVSKMDCFICSSYREGYSTAVTESVILKTPVLTTLCSGMEEILGDDNAGLIVENSNEGLLNGMLKYLRDANFRRDMQLGVIKRAEFFSKDFAIAQFEQFIGVM